MGKLYIVPTPVGNLEDVTLRALRILKECDFILAEDTRKSGILLRHFMIEKKLYVYNKDNEHAQIKNIVEQLRSGSLIALISDSGTPAISDPGFLLIRECIKNGIEIECLPGATAFVPALVESGFPCDEFLFVGFLPHKKGRQTELKMLSEERRTFILYESPNRLVRLLNELIELCGSERKVSVSRELTKLFAETKRGTLSEVHDYFSKKVVKGEIVVVVEGK